MVLVFLRHQKMLVQTLDGTSDCNDDKKGVTEQRPQQREELS